MLVYFSIKKRRENVRWNGGDNFTQLQFVQNRRLTGGIETHHENALLFLAPAIKKFSKKSTHCNR